MTKADFVASNAYTGTEESIGSSETRDNTNNTEHAQQDSAASEDISSFNNSDRMPDADEESLMGSGLSGQQENPPNTKEKTTKMQQFLVIATAFATVFQTSGTLHGFCLFR
ncbi:hypothetical protein BU16DRAFT_559698 [Lophium mytilinum]|uniref:Uncharacterized protein n=1 Tax=Lophium mytilinum TaxID=390894 RepID=A0A6A6R3K1_9PEZI|nr:hypothetical protein BU16DRAFT_559698 [Lophium mytilinum]